MDKTYRNTVFIDTRTSCLIIYAINPVSDVQNSLLNLIQPHQLYVTAIFLALEVLQLMCILSTIISAKLLSLLLCLARSLRSCFT